jgi:hypothetical protein
MEEIYANYVWHRDRLLEECRVEFGDEDLSRYPSWPVFRTPDETFATACFDSCCLDVHADHLVLSFASDWDEEHGLKVWVRHESVDVASE